MLRLAERRPAATADRSAAELADRTGIIAASVPGSSKRAGKPGGGRRLTGGLGAAGWGAVGRLIDKSSVGGQRGPGAGAAEQVVGGQVVGGQVVDGPTVDELLVNGPTAAGAGVAATGCTQAGSGVAATGCAQAGSGVAAAGGVQAGSGVAEAGGTQAGAVPVAVGRVLVSPQAVVGRRSRRAVVIGASAVMLVGLGWLGGGLVTGGFSGSRPDTVATQAEPQVVVAPPGSWPTRPQVPVTSEAGPATVYVPVSPQERPIRKRVTTPPPVTPRQDIPLGPRQDVPRAGADQDAPRAGDNPPAPAPSVASRSDFQKVVDHRWQPWTGLVRKTAGGR
ncbi:hypothetical protein ATK36_3099 [Amycolatopsis sulphurea]|uniref:Uncharacterized protein n=1 Tax=Amycolatopsis sulphurea TaxID=76022 RepID=A0A2A9F9C4_9PSEU|nr:hypothetical protein [Amycolatopsis sulphurea]PFG48027.1 hypothetical protein ATK36_3099 [Amycolatopsis sulphurea]